jgi:hypothetical protein
MAGAYLTIRLPEFHGEGSDDLEKHLFIFEKILEAKNIRDEDTKVAQLAITFKNRILD